MGATATSVIGAVAEGALSGRTTPREVVRGEIVPEDAMGAGRDGERGAR
jgi:hypothetical protein